MKSNSTIRRPAPAVRFTLADRVVASGQHLRIDETVTHATTRLTMAAQWAQARTGGAR